MQTDSKGVPLRISSCGFGFWLLVLGIHSCVEGCEAFLVTESRFEASGLGFRL